MNWQPLKCKGQPESVSCYSQVQAALSVVHVPTGKQPTLYLYDFYLFISYEADFDQTYIRTCTVCTLCLECCSM